MDKRKIAVLFGGVSSEHDVSLLSASSVLRNIPSDRFDVVRVGITKDGEWFRYSGETENIENGSWVSDKENLLPCSVSPDRSVHGIITFNKDGDFSAERIDAAFPVLHGRNGEDGTVQGLFALAKIPCVGCDLLSSAVCMDKAVTNTLLDSFGVPHTAWASVTERELADFDALEGSLSDKLGYPMFVKPANAGSSVGISKVKDKASLKEAFSLAFKHDKKVVVERNITGRELECAVLGNGEPVSSVVGEVLSCNEFYDYDAKYLAGESRTLIPADLPEEKQNEIRALAEKAYLSLGCSGLSRVDFLLEESTGIPYLNELNTLPGFTSISMYPKLMEATGVPYPELIARLIDYAVEKSGELI